MSSSLPKYVRTENSFVIYSNCIPNVDMFAKVFGYECHLDNAGFVQLCKTNQRIGFQPSGEIFVTGCEALDETQEEQEKATHETNYIDKNEPLRYITTSSRFIIFTSDLSYKEMAGAVLSGFVMQGAGLVYFEEVEGKLTAKCYGESEELHLKSREIDSIIINDAFGIEVAMPA